MGMSAVLHPWYAVRSTGSTLHCILHSDAMGGYLVDDFPWPRGMEMGQTDPLPMRGCFRSEPQLGHVILQHHARGPKTSSTAISVKHTKARHF